MKDGSKLQRKYQRLTSAVAVIAVVLGLVLTIGVMYFTRQALGIPMDAGPLEGTRLSFLTWIMIVLISIPILIYASMVIVAGAVGLIMTAGGNMSLEEAKAYALYSKYPKHWFFQYAYQRRSVDDSRVHIARKIARTTSEGEHNEELITENDNFLPSLEEDLKTAGNRIEKRFLFILCLLVPLAMLYERSPYKAAWMFWLFVGLVFAVIAYATYSFVQKKQDVAKNRGLVCRDCGFVPTANMIMLIAVKRVCPQCGRHLGG